MSSGIKIGIEISQVKNSRKIKDYLQSVIEQLLL